MGARRHAWLCRQCPAEVWEQAKRPARMQGPDCRLIEGSTACCFRKTGLQEGLLLQAIQALTCTAEPLLQSGKSQNYRAGALLQSHCSKVHAVAAHAFAAETGPRTAQLILLQNCCSKGSQAMLTLTQLRCSASCTHRQPSGCQKYPTWAELFTLGFRAAQGSQ